MGHLALRVLPAPIQDYTNSGGRDGGGALLSQALGEAPVAEGGGFPDEAVGVFAVLEAGEAPPQLVGPAAVFRPWLAGARERTRFGSRLPIVPPL
jgi:hypothetical protein